MEEAQQNTHIKWNEGWITATQNTNSFTVLWVEPLSPRKFVSLTSLARTNTLGGKPEKVFETNLQDSHPDL